VLPRLDGRRKRSVLQFLSEAGLINVDHRQVLLDLSEADLRAAFFPELNLRKANLSGADLRWTLAITPHNKPRRLDVPETLLGLLPSQLAAPIRKKSLLLETTIPCAPAPGHQRRSDSSCRTRPLYG
jgi:hypothetical protein